ncbi:MAG: ribonuclease domain-containing protein [Mycobacteriales bacterium]
MPSTNAARFLRTRRPLLALIGLLLVAAVGYGVQALSDGGHSSTSGSHSSRPARPGARAVPASSLPEQARRTITLIEAGGPFLYSSDGAVFRNDEHRLPGEPYGYYHEYTVTTPGESDRGARRIIRGDGGDYYYTGDHYATFVRVAPNS